VGEKLTPEYPEEPWYLVLVPQVSVSTAEIFSDPLLTRNTPPIKVRPVPKGNSRNDCLPVVTRRYPEVRNALNLLGKFTEAKLTGTGSCVFGGFPSKAEADKVSALLTETLTGFVAKGSNISMLHRKLQSLL
jgi:4-diphosphocytidyl-2-C-methyl-D-erythritol kinase